MDDFLYRMFGAGPEQRLLVARQDDVRTVGALLLPLGIDDVGAGLGEVGAEVRMNGTGQAAGVLQRLSGARLQCWPRSAGGRVGLLGEGDLVVQVDVRWRSVFSTQLSVVSRQFSVKSCLTEY